MSRVPHATLLLIALWGLGACTSSPGEVAAEAPAEALAPPVRYQAWRCDDGRGLATALVEGSSTLRVRLADRQLRLAPVRKASGAAWEGEGVLVWMHGEAAMLEVDGTRAQCDIDRRRSADLEAAARGALLRALGNEPGWVLELAPDAVVWTTDYGTRQLRFGAPVRREDPAASQTWWLAPAPEGEGPGLRIAVAMGPCRDDGDQPFPARVTVHLDGRMLHGCGRYLSPALLP
jgi:membrane-bound inhibitor of C-type lysozyme